MKNPIKAAGGWFLHLCESVGEMLNLFAETTYYCRWVIQKRHSVLEQMKRVGYDSLPIAGAMALFTGMVLALHSGYALRQFGVEEMLVQNLTPRRGLAPILPSPWEVRPVGAVGQLCLEWWGR